MRALVRRPGPQLADGIVTHQDRVPVDVERALEQWHAYVATFRDHGWDVAEVAPVDDCPDAVFIEDAVVVFDDLAVVTRPGAPSRRAETDTAETAVLAAGLDVAHIAAPATLDGGDVLKIGRDVWVGIGGRTTAAAADQLCEVLAPRGWNVRPVRVTRVLHLKSAVTALPDGTVIGHPDHVDEPWAWSRFLAIPEPTGAHVVHLGDDRLLMAAGAPRSAAMFRERGYRPVEVDISEYEKLEGCVTCLSVRIRT